MDDADKLGKDIEAELNGENNNANNNQNNNAPSGSGAADRNGEDTKEQTFKLKDGREVTGEQLLDEFNRKNQELYDFQEEAKKRKPENDTSSNGSLSARDQAVLSELKTKFKVATLDELETKIDERIDAKTQDLVNKSSTVSVARVKISEAMDDLEEDFDGSEEVINGVKIAKPKVDRQKVLKFIVDNPNQNLSPLEIARSLYIDDFVNYETQRKLANGGNSNGNSVPATEGNNGGGDHSQPPSYKSKYDFSDGSVEKAVREMINA